MGQNETPNVIYHEIDYSLDISRFENHTKNLSEHFVSTVFIKIYPIFVCFFTKKKTRGNYIFDIRPKKYNRESLAENTVFGHI